MELSGTIQNGTVLLEAAPVLANGTHVRVIVPDSVPAAPLTHYELLRDIIGQAVDLPEDMALNHNNYIRGGPKK